MAHRYSVFITHPAPYPGATAHLSDADSHHIRSVLRGQPGMKLHAVSRSDGRSFSAEVIALEPLVEVRLLEEEAEAAPAPRVRALVLSLSKGKHNDEVCEKACELGIEHLILFQAARSVVKIEGENKLERLRRIAESAAKQSKKRSIPEIHTARTLPELFSTLKTLAGAGERYLCCSLSSDARPLREITPPAGRVNLAIGPEADFTADEEAALREFGFEPVSLGPYPLRVETAAVAAIAGVHTLWGYCGQNE